MFVVSLAFLIGCIAGLRALIVPALLSCAARSGWLPLDGTLLAFLGYKWTPWVLSAAAVAELIHDKLPNTPSRTAPPQFITRLLSGALSGYAITLAHGKPAVGIVGGILGAIAGTFVSAELRARLAKAIGGKDLPVALLEDTLAFLGAVAIVKQLS